MSKYLLLYQRETGAQGANFCIYSRIMHEKSDVYFSTCCITWHFLYAIYGKIGYIMQLYWGAQTEEKDKSCKHLNVSIAIFPKLGEKRKDSSYLDQLHFASL